MSLDLTKNPTLTAPIHVLDDVQLDMALPGTGVGVPDSMGVLAQPIMDGEGDIRIPFGARFDCEFEQIHAGAASLISDPLASIPKQILELAQGIKTSLCEVHQRLGHEVTYLIKEKILQLPDSTQASRFVSIVQVDGEKLPEEVRRAVVERFFERCFAAEYWIHNTSPPEEFIIPADAFEGSWGGTFNGEDLAEVLEPSKPLEIADVPDFEGLVEEAVVKPATDFARANAGKQVKCEVVTPAGAFICEGKAARPESRHRSTNPISVVRQIDGIAISGYKVNFVVPGEGFDSIDDNFGDGREPIPHKFVADIGQGKDSDAPSQPLLTKVCQLIGDEALRVKIRVVVTEVRGVVRYQLVGIERNSAPEYVLPSL